MKGFFIVTRKAVHASREFIIMAARYPARPLRVLKSPPTLPLEPYDDDRPIVAPVSIEFWAL